jgi:hypothetical protein
VTPAEQADEAVRRLQHRPYDPHSFVERVEAIEMEGEPGVLLLWTQPLTDGMRSFGLALPVALLAENALAVGELSWIEDLELAVEEPRGVPDPSRRHWFTDSPSNWQ